MRSQAVASPTKESEPRALVRDASWIIRFGSIACIACVMLGCQPNLQNASPPYEDFIASTKPAERIDSFVKGWFLLLEDPSHVSPDFIDFLGHEDVVLRSNDETIRGRKEVFAWVTGANHQFARVEFQIGPVEVLHEEVDLFRARFDVDRRAWDEDGLLHLSRTRHSWQIGVGQQNRLQLLDAEESAVLSHPGTGSKILCL